MVVTTRASSSYKVCSLWYRSTIFFFLQLITLNNKTIIQSRMTHLEWTRVSYTGAIACASCLPQTTQIISMVIVLRIELWVNFCHELTQSCPKSVFSITFVLKVRTAMFSHLQVLFLFKHFLLKRGRCCDTLQTPQALTSALCHITPPRRLTPPCITAYITSHVIVNCSEQVIRFFLHLHPH